MAGGAMAPPPGGRPGGMPGMAGPPGMGGPGMGPGMRGGSKPSLRKALVVFQNRHYRFLWLSSAASFTGMQMQQVARALLAWELTHSFGATGMISLSFGLPMLLFSLIGGAVADRLEKRNLTLMTQGTTGILAFITAVMVVTDTITIELLFIIGLIQGTFFAFGMPARSPLMALVVGPQHLMSAMALSQAAMNATRLFGPALAGVLVAVGGIETAYFTQAVMYAISAALLLMVPTGLGNGFEMRRRSGMFREIGNGLSYAIHEPRLRVLFLMAFIPSLFAMPYIMLLAGFVQEDLGQGEEAFGYLQSITGVGALLGSLGVASMTEFDRKPLLQLAGGVLGGAALVLLGVWSMAFGYPGAIAAVAILGLTLTSYQTLNQTMIMEAADPEYYGRVMSINMLTFSVMPLMAAPLGVAADRIGATNLFVIQGGLVVGMMLLAALLNPKYIFGREAPRSWDEADEVDEALPGAVPPASGVSGAVTPSAALTTALSEAPQAVSALPAEHVAVEPARVGQNGRTPHI